MLLRWKGSVAAVFLLGLFFLQVLSVGAAPEFSVSPGTFTAKDVPPRGEPYVIDKRITLRNRDNESRLVTVGVVVPSENEVAPGYEPIPMEKWVRPVPTSVTVEENSSAEVQISLNIPRWENLTNKKWEVWIPVERQPLPGEPAVLQPTVRMKIETTEDLPSDDSIDFKFPYLLIGGITAVIVVLLVVFLLFFRRKGEKRTRWGLTSESMGNVGFSS